MPHSVLCRVRDLFALVWNISKTRARAVGTGQKYWDPAGKPSPCFHGCPGVVLPIPRANHSGAVVLLKKEKNQRALSLEHMFEGEGLASSFGYDVAVVDLNSDGYGLG